MQQQLQEQVTLRHVFSTVPYTQMLPLTEIVCGQVTLKIIYFIEYLWMKVICELFII